LYACERRKSGEWGKREMLDEKLRNSVY